MTVKENAVLSVDFKHSYSNISEDIEKSARVCIDINAIRSGLIKEVGANRLSILLAIVAHTDSTGRAFPSQEKIAEITGQGRATIQRNLDALCEAEYKGQKLLYREVVGSVRKKTVYTLNEALITNTDDVEQELKKEDKKMQKRLKYNAKDLATYFLQVFEESFGYQYNITWKRDIPMIKNKLTDKHDADTLTAIVDIGVGEYKKRWANDKYPHPSVGMLCGWLGNEAVGIYNKRKKKEEKQARKQQESEKQDQTDQALDKIFDL